MYLHGGLEGAVRDTIIDSFRNGLSKVLITTNVLARGIDVQTVSMVVNYVSYSLVGCDLWSILVTIESGCPS